MPLKDFANCGSWQLGQTGTGSFKQVAATLRKCIGFSRKDKTDEEKKQKEKGHCNCQPVFAETFR
jgi:hypothetical protein